MPYRVKQSDRREGRGRQREYDPHQDLQVVGAVQIRRFVKVLRYRLEKGPHDYHIHYVDSRRKNNGENRVAQMQRLDNHVSGNHSRVKKHGEYN